MRVGLISLGCAKNLVDTEIMLGSLLKDGLEIVNDAARADAVIVNTCAFIDAAQEESIDTILESAQVREAQNRGQALIVSGCLPQRFRGEPAAGGTGAPVAERGPAICPKHASHVCPGTPVR